MIVKDSITFVDSNVTAHFTDALTFRASEYEDLDLTGTAGLGGPARCYITSIRLLSRSNLAWTVAVHNKDNTAPGTDSVLPASFNDNTAIDFWSWTAANALPVGTVFLYATSGLKIPYRDDENRGQLHVSLHNGSTTEKLTASDYVHMRFGIIGAA